MAISLLPLSTRRLRQANRLAASSQDAVENVLDTTYGDDTCFLALSLLYDDRNWGTIEHSIDHLFAQEEFRKRNVPDAIKELGDDFGNLALVIGDENSGKKSCPLDKWLASRSPEYLKRHLIPPDQSLWHMENYEKFLIERRKLLRARIAVRYWQPIRLRLPQPSASRINEMHASADDVGHRHVAVVVARIVSGKALDVQAGVRTTVRKTCH
jgi:Protein of unknown function (DUF1524)